MVKCVQQILIRDSLVVNRESSDNIISYYSNYELRITDYGERSE